MPGRLKVRILSGRNLPVMDRASELTDAFVEVRFGNDTYKTEVCKKSLNPQWNSEWFKFEAEDEMLQDEPLDLRVLDYDTYSAHDAIGKVYIDLNPLLSREAPNIISGWFPIYDTMHGIRGELNVQVRVELFSDFNKFRQSSCGIQFFCSWGVPCGWRIQEMLGFVEELVVNDDPEYQWIDKIRTPRASNEARQRLFSKLSGELQRKLGVKVLEMGGNAVLGYHQNFDLEGESGIVVRAIGTAVSLTRSTVGQSSPILHGHGSPAISLTARDTPQEECHSASTQGDTSNPGGLDSPSFPQGSSNSVFTSVTTPSQGQPAQNRHSASPVRVVTTTNQNRRSSDSEVGSFHQGNTSVQTSINAPPHTGHSKACGLLQSIDMVEFPFFTMRSFPPGFIMNLGGVVSARSVKLLDKIHNPEEPETRDAWWSELRTEIRVHATKLGCHAVLAYQEQTAISDEVIILSAMGTAAKINLNFNSHSQNQTGGLSTGVSAPHTPSSAPILDKMTTPLSGLKGMNSSTSIGILGDKAKDKASHLFVDISLANQAQDWKDEAASRCSMCHIPYSPNSLPFEIQLSKCALCRTQFVPEVLFTTIDPPDNMPVCSKGSFIQARLCRAKSKNKNSEQSAREVSDSLPFLEYEIHNQLINKMKIRGLNCLFGLKIQISLGENILAAVATATGTYLGPLPAPPVPVLSTQVATAEESEDIMNLQRKFAAAAQMHRDCLNSELGDMLTDLSPPPPDTDDESDNGDDETDLLIEKSKDRNTFVLVVDDLKDESMSLILEDATPPEGFDICNTQSAPGISVDRLTGNMQMFAQILHVRFNPTLNTGLEFSNIFNTILKRICFKMRSFKPCCLADVSFNVDLADEDEVTVVVTGCCLTLEESLGQLVATSNTPFKFLNQASETTKKTATNQTDDMMFPLDGVGDQMQLNQPSVEPILKENTELTTQTSEISKSSRVVSNKGITLTPLSFVPDYHITCYLGYYNFFFIRESTSVRENGGIGGLMQSFLVQVLAIVRAHVRALGGNALVAFNMWQCVLDNNPHKNQGQCLINVSGDIVLMSHDMDRNDSGDINSLIIPATS